VWARQIHDPLLFLVLRIRFVFDSGKGAEKQVTGVGHDGGAARGDAVLGLMMEETGQEFVDGGGGGEVREAGGKSGGEVGCFVASGRGAQVRR
jgi:hypothetical protein